MNGKIDFIVCEDGGSWYIESLNVPQEIALQPDGPLVQWAKSEHFDNDPDVVFVGVYWRDEILDASGISTDKLIHSGYKNIIRGKANARN